jgi:hypothetical protein
MRRDRVSKKRLYSKERKRRRASDQERGDRITKKYQQT